MATKIDRPQGAPCKSANGDFALRGKKLRSLRLHLGMTQADMADELNMREDALGKMERGDEARGMHDKKRQVVLSAFKIDPQFFQDEVDIQEFEEGLKQDLIFKITRPNNLPRQDGAFIGRNNEIDSLLDKLKGRAYRLSITGVGGVGKSALAVEVARRCLKKNLFDAAIWFTVKKEEFLGNETVSRTGYAKSDLGGLLTRILEVLDTDYVKNLPPVATQKSRCRELLKEKKVLLLVDNMETVEDEHIKLFIEEPPEPSKVLITDRRSVPNSDAIKLMALSKDESIQMIKNESKSHNMCLEETEQERLVGMLGGVPLAIKWAIGQLASNYLDIDMLFKRLNEKSSPILDFLFDTSFKNLTPDSKAILAAFALLTVPVKGRFIGTLNAMEREDDRLKDSLSQLMQHALILKIEEENLDTPTLSYTPSLESTYRVLPLTRNFVLQQKEFVNYEFSVKIIRYFYDHLKFLTKNPTWPSPELSVYVAENKEILKWAVEEASHMEEYDLVVGLVRYLGYSLGIIGKHDLRLSLSKIALEAAEKQGNYLEQARILLLNISWVYLGWYDFDECKKSTRQGEKIAEKIKDRYMIAVAKRTRGLIHKEQGEYEMAEQLLLEATTLFEKEQDSHFKAVNYGSLASLYRDMKRLNHSEKYLNKAICIANDIENNEEILSVFKQKMANLLLQQGNLNEAEICIKEALSLTRRINKPKGEAYCEHYMAIIEEKRGNIQAAGEHIERAANIFMDHGAKQDYSHDLKRIRRKVETIKKAAQ